MNDTYETAAEAEVDRAQQRDLIRALNAWCRALRRDECGAWCISGKHGSVHTWGDGRTWVIYVGCRSTMHRTHTKHRLAFCTVTQDCDKEGCLRLHQFPTPEQATLLREILGIRKRAELSPEERERRQIQGKRLAFSLPRRRAA